VRRRRFGDLVVLIPGLTGSVLRKDGRDVWGPSTSAILGAALSGGRRFEPLILREDPLDRDELGDGVTASRVFPDVHLIPGVWKIDGYSRLAAALCSGLGLVPGRSFFEFPYDWRRDVRVAGRILARNAHRWLSRWRESSGQPDARLVLVAHSMGGLVARAFLELHDGWRTTRALVAFGTPFRGAPSAVDALVNGARKGPRGLVDLTALARSCTSVHQLLPLYPVVHSGSRRLARVTETVIPGLDPLRAAHGVAFHEEVRRAVEAHRRSSHYRRDGYEVFPVVGIGQATAQGVRREDGRVEVLPTLGGEDLSGDGTVPRVSATPLERSKDRRELFVGTRHASLQSSGVALTHLVGLLGDYGVDLGAFRRARSALVRLGLDAGDVYWRDEPVVVRTRISPDTSRRRAEGMRLGVRVRLASGGRVVARATLRPSEHGDHVATIPPLRPGSYRVTVSGGRGVEPVEDVFVVARERRP